MPEDIKILMQGAPGYMRELQGVLQRVGVRARLYTPKSLGQPDA